MTSKSNAGAASENASIFQSDLSVKDKLDRARTELLDLSARNRLLNMPRFSKSSKSVEIVDEKSAEIFRMLVTEGRPFTFLAGRPDRSSNGEEAVDEQDAGDVIDVLAQPDDEIDDRGVFARHSDTRLQTRLTPKGLQKRLLELYFDARTLEEEQGVNILFVALGALKWIDPGNAFNTRYAPLVLLPVSLERGNAGEKFKLRIRQEEFASNLSLEAFLDRTQGIRLPAFEASDAFDPMAYFADVAEAVSAKPDWEVMADDIVLGFFSFAKFLMYRDLDPENWPKDDQITDRGLIKGLLSEGFEGGGDMIPEDANIDPFIPPSQMLHILDSDSSQALAVHEVRNGRDMVIQGPPGTGKSQTIANMIAAAVADGKTVLFVAEKMAALDVVKRRLDATGVGDACLELHSNKANKRALLEELRRTWELGPPRGQDPGSLHTRLLEARDTLNAHAQRMHRLHSTSNLSPFQAIGQLSRLRLDGEKPNDIALEKPETWSADDFAQRHDVVDELADRIAVIGRPEEHVWRGVGLSSILPTDLERLSGKMADLCTRLTEFAQGATALAADLQLAPPGTLAGFGAVRDVADRIAAAPYIEGEALGNATWDGETATIAKLLNDGERLSQTQRSLEGQLREGAWQADVAVEVTTLSLLPPDFGPDGFRLLGETADILPSLQNESAGLARALGRQAPTKLDEAERLAEIGERVAEAPDVEPQVLLADLWEAGVERAADLVTALATLEGARAHIGDGLTAAAWDIDLSQARGVLASHGTGFLRFFNSEWRKANKLVRSVLSRPDQVLEDTLGQLDALSTGQSALKTIEADDTFGAAAFGAQWRGPRSQVKPLAALVEWMRSLKGLGAEPRMIAAERPDKTDVAARAKRTSDIARQARPILRSVGDNLGSSGNDGDGFSGLSWGDDGAELASLSAAVIRIHAADTRTGALVVEVPVTLAERLEILHLLQRGQDLSRAIDDASQLGRAAFGSLWDGASSDWAAVRAIDEWVRANGDIRLIASSLEDRSVPAGTAEILLAAHDMLIIDLAALEKDLQLDPMQALGVAHLRDAALDHLARRAAEWTDGGEQLFQWVAYRDRAERSKHLGCGEVVKRLADGRIAPEQAVPAFEMTYYEAVYADMVRQDPELGAFDGTLHGRLARDFADMDRQRIASASYEVVKAHYARVPARDGGAVGPLGVLRSEIARKRGHMPIRKLMEAAGPAIQALKPVMMMSPLSVAQFLAPGVFEFDLLVMDEASQIQPVDALGAVARARQVVVVGDPKQLPPTAFFSKLTGAANDDDEDGSAQVADIESILGLFTARGLPMRMLRWHYRSKHQSLIAVSNRQFYEHKLFIVPSPYTAEAGMGLRFHHITNGIFDAGGTRTNTAEAKVVAQAIVTHARDYPELSLGVAAFSAAQRRAILDQLEILRRSLPPEIEAFFQAHYSEPFFVKNLENVQGDERDVIFISVGYGATVPGGRVPMRFGPLGTDGGERRLNVLISRAKQRCEVFASMTDEDIDPDFAATRKGVFAFRMFMHFARTGRMTLAESTGRDHDSVFEEQVAKALQARGYQVHHQVGLAGFFIDLAVSDPERPGRYLIGIECDGASYHDAKSARERDRLRQSVLESHGWTIHRVWSTDWFQRPNEQLELIVARIEAAKDEHDLDTATRASRAVPYDIVTVDREDVTEIGFAPMGENLSNILYQEADIAKPGHLDCELHEAARGTLSALAEEVVEVEGPVHISEIVARLRGAWGLRRAGARIQEAVEAALQVSVKTGRLVRDTDFFSLPGRPVTVRDRSAVASSGLRRCEALPPTELMFAALNTVRVNFGATDEQVCTAVSRAFGFKSTSAQLRGVIGQAVEAAIVNGWIERRNDMLVTGPEAPVAERPSKPTSTLETLIAQGESEGLEFKATLRWDVDANTPNKKLEDIAIKTLAGLANRMGGTLLIGVSDNGTVTGLERDYACLGGNRDRLELHLTNLLSNHFGQACRASRIRVSFIDHGAQDVCRIDIDRSPTSVFVTTADARGVSAERFFVRSGNSTQELSPSQTAAYISEHFANT